MNLPEPTDQDITDAGTIRASHAGGVVAYGARCIAFGRAQQVVIIDADELATLRAAAEVASGFLPWHEPDHPKYEGAASDAGRRLRKALWPEKYSAASV